MNKSKVIAFTAILVTTLLSGCKATIRGKHEVEYPNGMKKTSQGEIILEESQAFLLRPITSLLATVGVFTQDDWEALNANEFYINIDDGNGSSFVDGNEIIFYVWDSGLLIESKVFETQTLGSNVYLKFPEQAEAWAEQFIDVSDKLTYEIDIVTTTNSSTTVRVSSYDADGLTASHSYSVTKPADDECSRFGCDPL